MSERSSGPPGPQPEGRPDDPVAFPERELDEALSQAAALAAELSDGVGSPEASESEREIAEIDLPRGARPRVEQIDMDHELSGLEQTIASTAREIGGSPAATVRTSGTSPEKSPPAVPDFMSEFTRPADTPTVSPPKPSPPAKSGPTGGGDSLKETLRPAEKTITAGVPSKLVANAPPAVAKSPTAAASAARAAASGTPGSDLMGSAPGVVGNITEPLSKLSTGKAFGSPGPEVVGQSADKSAAGDPGAWLRMAGRGVTLIELMDRPFEWVNPRVKHVLGWVAVATMATAIIVLAAALTANW